VLLYDQASRNIIGGSTPAGRNVVSGNIGWGVDIKTNANANSIVGNWIGPVGDGLHSLGNSEGGIRILEASNNRIGDGTAEASNSIIGNGPVGIQVTHMLSTGNSFARNAIANHSTIEIDLSGDGPTPNDANDQDSGPNQLQNYPTIDFVANSSSRVQISGVLESTANTLFQVDLYSEVPGVFGRIFLGTFPVLTNSSGSSSWRYELYSALPTNAKIYATARNAGTIATNTNSSNPKTQMLRSQLIHPAISRILAEAGHHATILIADGNYPASSKRGPRSELVSLNLMPGLVTCNQVLEAILSAISVEAIQTMMTETSGPYALDGDPPVWADYREAIRKADINVALEPIEKWEFYNRVSTVDHVLTVQTGDTQRYANILLTVGVRMF